MNRTATHAIVMAKLITNGKECGVQPFLIQIRDKKTHKPLPGKNSFLCFFAYETKQT